MLLHPTNKIQSLKAGRFATRQAARMLSVSYEIPDQGPFVAYIIRALQHIDKGMLHPLKLPLFSFMK